ncbi:MAG TPA: ATP-binding protein [bacterium]|nr:ATP-binding protein [bacterium]HPN45723.1 ATP-binding protein [bacterium]
MLENKSFFEKTQPIYIFEIINQDILKRLLDSYRFPLQTSLTVYYSKILPATFDTVKWLELKDRKEEMRLNSPICYCFRQDKPKYEKICKQCDIEITLKYYNKEWTEPKLFHCHLNLWEMTYPIFVQDLLIGIIYGGQVIVTENPDDWNKELKKYKKNVVWAPLKNIQTQELPSKSNQIEEIIAAIKKVPKIKNNNIKKDKLLNLIEEEKNKKINIEMLLERFKKFIEYGRTIEELLRDIHLAKAEAARRVHIHLMSKELSNKGDHLSEEPEEFWKTLDEAIANTLPDIKAYLMFELKEHKKEYEINRIQIFDRKIFKGTQNFEIFCKYFMKLFNKNCKYNEKFKIIDISDQLIKCNIDNLFNEIIADSSYKLTNINIIGFPFVDIKNKIIGGLICISLKNDLKNISQFYIDTFIDIIDVLSIVLSRHNIKIKRVKELGKLTHELKVPIVAIRGAADFILKTPGYKNFFTYDYAGDIWSWSDLMSILIDKANTLRYTEHKININPKQTFILRDVIASAIRQSKVLLDERGFSSLNINYTKESLQNFPPLWIDRNLFQQVIFNLLINSIKYAYDDAKAFQVMIEGDEVTLTIVFKDWGIGIDKDLEEVIFEEGVRGPDAEKIDVTGQGLGLWIVRQIVEAHGGDVRLTNNKWPTEFTISLPNSLRFQPLTINKGV